MDIRLLRYFLAVAEEGNITWAAQLLQISQPTLSRQIKQMEDELGVPLLVRGNQSVTLTPEGRLLRERAQTIVSLADKTAFELQHADGELEGEVAIGCGEVQGMAWLAKKMQQFRALHERVQFALFSSSADIIQMRIEQGLLDLGLLLEPADTNRYEYVSTHVQEHWTALVPNDHMFAGKSALTPKDLRGMQVIVPSRRHAKSAATSWLGPYYDEALVTGHSNLPTNAAAMVAAGLGVCLCIDTGAQYSGVTAVPLYPPINTGSIVVWKKQSTPSAAAAEFIRFLRG
ncbi:LysR family transcriptional regulator [Bifidobacterium saguini]|uniref:LysR family transcriptional regulator n=1 Tax=Bifidobacterium saguini TaxID=762210 RepID=A0ABX7SFC9_9BIFI|nr:LysR family transcriptional regulator [Bifidobacterium saguini]